jgi:hypothetical protein
LKKSFILTSLLLLFVQLSFSQNSKDKLFDYLPKSSEITNWQPGNNPEIYVGDDLYVFINGGAEIYHEYGFNKVVYNEYKDKKENSINVEIYEMKSSESAFGIYSFKIGRKGEVFSAGNDAFLQSYYMNFWKGNYLVILTGFDENDATINGIKAIAKVIDKKIKIKGKKPDLVKYLPKQNLQATHIKYLKGVLALFNQYSFGTGNIFNVSEAVIGPYNDYQLFIFKYSNEKECLNIFKNAKDKLQANQDFSNFSISKETISMKDQKDKFLSIKPFQKFILILLSDKQIDSASKYNFIQKHITQISK